MTNVSLACIERFFQTLSLDPREIYTYFWMDEAKGIAYETQHGAVERILSEVSEKASKGLTLHAVLNRTNMKGKSGSDVTSVRALCVDLDREIPREELLELVEGLDPHLVVESSPAKFHLYWPLSPEVPLDAWKLYQAGLSQYLSGDKNLSQVSHSIRVPGVPRITKKGEEFLPRVIWCKEQRDRVELDVKAVLSKFPWIEGEAKKAKALKTNEKKALKACLSGKKFNGDDLPSRDRAVYDTVFSKTAVGEVKSEEEALALGFEVASKLPEKDHAFTEKEIQKSVRSGFRAGAEVWQKKVSAVSEGFTPCEFKYDYSDKFLNGNKFTEAGVRARALQRFGSRLLRVDKNVFGFDADRKVWVMQGEGAGSTVVNEFAREAQYDATRDPFFIAECCIDSKGNPSLTAKRAAQERLLKLGLTYAVSRSLLASSEIRYADSSLFDANPSVLFCANGVLDMESLELRDAKAEDYLLKRSRVRWVSGAKCPKWLEFIGQVFARNSEPERMVLFMQELFGYSLSGLIVADKVFCHVGDGCNGKSKVLWALNHLGGDYSRYLDPDDFVTKKNGFSRAIERVGAKLEGHRIAIVDDISTKATWNDEFLKCLTGKVITARAEYETGRQIANRASVHIGLNKVPESEDENVGVLRRLCIIPYNEQFDHVIKKSNEIDAFIEEEAEGILVWAVEGYRRYLSQGGFNYTEEMERAVEEYKEDNFVFETLVTDLFETYTKEELLRNRVEPLFLSDLVQEVNSYIEDSGASKTVSADELGRALKRKFKVDPIKKRCPVRKNMFRAYFIKRKYEEKNLGDLAAL